nr:transposase, mutator type [Tanacetum cinerariifolium]
MCVKIAQTLMKLYKMVSSVNVVDIKEFCLHNLKDMVVKLGLGYGLHPLNVDADVLEMAKYVKDNKIILVYVEHGISNVDSSIFVIPKKEVTIAVDNHLRKPHIEIDSSPDVNRNLTPMCHRNLKKEWEQVSSKALSIESVDHIDGLDEILVDDVFDLEMLFETEEVGLIRKFKEVEVDTDNESEEESDTEENDTNGIDSEDLDYDPKHDEVFDDDEHIVKDVSISMDNFNFIPYPKHGLSIGGVEVQDHDLDIIDYDSFGNDLDGGIDFERRIQLRELKRIGKQKNKGPWPGQRLTTIGVDANNKIYPVAYVIVKAERKASWCWFLNLLRVDLGIEANFHYTFISDRHIHEDMKSQFKGDGAWTEYVSRGVTLLRISSTKHKERPLR